ncbi:MAG: hypothetical protein NVS9B12_14970 [Vulcanimicrobiaceae bacterium]
MKKLLLLLTLVLLGANGPLSVHVEAQRSSLDLLDPVSFVISVVNNGKQPVVARFPTPAMYDISVGSPGGEIWRMSAGRIFVQVMHSYTFLPGKTLIGTYVWDTLAQGRSLPPGDYRARVWITDLKYRPSASVPLRFALPLPVHAAFAVPLHAAVTLAGTLRAQSTAEELVDGTGAIRLSKRISMQAPGGTFIVRGYLSTEYGVTFLSVDRWTRAFDNVEPAPLPAVPQTPIPPLPRRTPAPYRTPASSSP